MKLVLTVYVLCVRDIFVDIIALWFAMTKLKLHCIKATIYELIYKKVF